MKKNSSTCCICSPACFAACDHQSPRRVEDNHRRHGCGKRHSLEQTGRYYGTITLDGCILIMREKTRRSRSTPTSTGCWMII